MSQITTLSQFYFGHTITTSNRKVSFSEGGGELIGSLPVGDYTLTEYAAALALAMSQVGGQTYTGAVNRTTRKITISASGTFSILAATGTTLGTTTLTLAGFTTTDRTGTNTYEGDIGSGSAYKCQYPFDQYQSIEDYQLLESATVNVSAKGIVQTISFGNGARMQCNIRLITNLDCPKNSPFFFNATGIVNARTFLSYLITKAKVEFMPDIASPATFFSVLLETTPSDKDGTQYILNNMGVPDFYETGKLLFRQAQG